MADTKQFWIGIKGLIENSEGKVLLLQASLRDHVAKTERYWDIPGGRIEEGQTIPQVLAREIKEETGVTTIESSSFFTAVISNHEIPVEGRVLGLALMIYKVKIPEGSKIKLSPEHIAYEWVDKAEAAKRLAHKYPPEFTTLLSK